MIVFALAAMGVFAASGGMASTAGAQAGGASESAFQNLAGRVACKLVELGSRYGEPGPDGVRIPIRLTQETVANMLGASRENVSRALARLARQGEVRHQHGVLVIPRLDELAERYSDFEETPQRMMRRK